MKKIKLLFDSRILYDGMTRTGIYFAAKNIFDGLCKHPDIDLFLFDETKDSLNINTVNKELGGGFKKDDIIGPADDLSCFDAFFSPVYCTPGFLNKYPNISRYTILYDTIPLVFSEYYANNIGWFADLTNGINFDEFYFSISKHTTRDFLKFHPNMDKNKVTEIPLATNFPYKPNKDKSKLDKARKKYNIPTDKKYLFSLCSLEPRKNLIRAVKCFIQFIDKNKIDDLVFVLGGGAWAGFIEKFEKEVPEYKKYADKIIRAGYVADEDLEILYSNAEWFVYTSQYEGFGMPPLEAMACGTPVITSNNSSLPEVVGDAAITIDYDSDEQHIAAYEAYYYNEKLRRKNVTAGLKRAKLFSWERCVDIIVNKMQEIEDKKANTPLVTVITASYNLIKGGRRDWFIQNMESVRHQTYKNIEHIVIDGASSDGTLDLLKEYQDKGWIKYYSEPDKGIYDAINKGIKRAKGKYVVFLNSDDFYCDNRAVEYLVKRAESTNADAVYGNAVRVKPNDLSVMNYWPGKENFENLFCSCPCHQTLLVKIDVMKQLGMYDIKYKVCADSIFMIRMLEHNKKLSGLDVNIVNFRDGGFSSSNKELEMSERINGLYSEYGRVHGLTRYDCVKLCGFSFLNLPLPQAIALGAKLDRSDWSKAYFTKLIQHHIALVSNSSVAQNILASRSSGPTREQKISKRCYLFDVLPLFKTTQRYGVTRWLAFGFLPVLKIKNKREKIKSYLFGFIPFTRVSDKYGVYKLRVFGIPLLKGKRG